MGRPVQNPAAPKGKDYGLAFFRRRMLDPQIVGYGPEAQSGGSRPYSGHLFFHIAVDYAFQGHAATLYDNSNRLLHSQFILLQ